MTLSEISDLLFFADLTMAIKPLLVFFTGMASVAALTYVARTIISNIR